MKSSSWINELGGLSSLVSLKLINIIQSFTSFNLHFLQL